MPDTIFCYPLNPTFRSSLEERKEKKILEERRCVRRIVEELEGKKEEKCVETELEGKEELKKLKTGKKIGGKFPRRTETPQKISRHILQTTLSESPSLRTLSPRSITVRGGGSHRKKFGGEKT